ncbi:MAG TPA: arylesterase [Symbiobacteriaceae bacterium]|nr:arylesterase [Symbiobacteriaceae bacterium]
MRNRYTVYACLVVLLFAMGMVGCGGKKKSPEPTVAPLAKPAIATPATNVDRAGWPVIVTFGDSLTAGQGVAFDKNYPSQLQAELDRLGYKYRIVNAGISGDTTSGGVGRVKSVIAHKPEIVILELGPNDGLQGLPMDQMKKNLQTMIEALQAEKIQVVLAGMQIPPNYGPEHTETFKKTFEELAQQYKLPLIPFFLEGVAAKPELNQMDGIHPTAEGYVYVVKNVMGTLEPLLKKP